MLGGIGAPRHWITGCIVSCLLVQTSAVVSTTAQAKSQALSSDIERYIVHYDTSVIQYGE